MIALALGLALLGAFLVVLQRCRAAFAVNESLARLQDSARHALSVVVPDIEHAGFYGSTNHPVAVVGGLPPGVDACGPHFALDLAVPAQGFDNTFGTESGARDCSPTRSAGGAKAGSDTLTLRFASQNTTSPRAGRLQIHSHKLSALGPLRLFGDGRAPGPIDETHEVRDLEVHTYYVANSSVDRAGWPALRVKSLTESQAAAQFRDEEVLPGVEDLQVEFGVARLGVDGDPRIQYVAPGTTLARDGRIVALRLWLRIRSDVTEPSFEDDRELTYANVRFTPSSAEKKHRRLLIERTVALRNARSP